MSCFIAHIYQGCLMEGTVNSVSKPLFHPTLASFSPLRTELCNVMNVNTLRRDCVIAYGRGPKQMLTVSIAVLLNYLSTILSSYYASYSRDYLGYI